MRARLALGLAIGGLVATALTPPLDAHKPITSPYTFNEDVFPILRDRCGACHVAGGVAPMPLTTAEETVPWGESIRLELIAGHMPPWAATSNGARLRHADGLTARELDVLLTWVTGGTPPGDPEKAPPSVTRGREWPLGAPDVTLPLPEVTLPADQMEATREFVVPLEPSHRRALRAVDLLPGTGSVVRSALVFLRSPSAGLDDVDRVLAAWVPGDTPAALPAGTVFAMAPDAELVVRVRYKKTWQHEREAMTDTSAVGLYFAAGPGEPARTWTFVMPREEQPSAGAPALSGAGSRVVFGDTIGASMRVLSVYPTEAAGGADLKVDAVLPSGGRQRLIALSPRPGWERRYWFEAPFDLPRGTRLELAATFDPARASLPPGGTPLLVVSVAPSPTR
jgi:hypothetical protein